MIYIDRVLYIQQLDGTGSNARVIENGKKERKKETTKNDAFYMRVVLRV